MRGATEHCCGCALFCAAEVPEAAAEKEKADENGSNKHIKNHASGSLEGEKVTTMAANIKMWHCGMYVLECVWFLGKKCVSSRPTRCDENHLRPGYETKTETRRKDNTLFLVHP